MRTLPISSASIKFSNSFKSSDVEPKRTDVPINVSEKPDKSKASKPSQMVTAAVAVAALGLSAVAVLRGIKSGEGELKNELTNELKSEIEKLKTELLNKESFNKTEIEDKIQKLVDRIGNIENSSLKDELMGQINSLREALTGVASQMTAKAGFYSEVVNVNGKDLVLGQILNPLGAESMGKMTKTLQTESLKRLLGIGNKTKELPEQAHIRIPTSEFKGFASTGGMSIVPKEIADNLAKILAGKQDAQIIVDIPMYRGNVEKGSVKEVLTTRYNDLIQLPDGTYNYIQTVVKKENGVLKENSTTSLGILKKIGSMDVKVLTDTKATTEKVDMYMNERVINLNYAEVKDSFSQNVKDAIAAMKNEETKEIGNLVLTKDKNGNIKAGAKVKTILYDNGKGGKFDLDVAIDNAKDIYNNRAIASGETERFTYFSKFFYENLIRTEEARVLHNLDATNAANKIAEIKQNIEKLKKEGTLTPEIEAKLQKDIADNESKKATALNNYRQHLGADLIIGNDWQSGPITAMIRQLTTVKKYYGMNPLVADKIYDTPVVTILHNAKLNGGNWNSQAKLLNVMFGEHAATIAKNSHMPNIGLNEKTTGFDSALFNGLMERDGVHPQMMAVTYSDFVVPVSDGYAEEIATNDIFGQARRKLYAFRIRKDSYGNLENLRTIARNNKIDENLLTNANPTMIGITNGADRANNTLTAAKAKQMGDDLSLKESLIPYQAGMDKLDWHNKNKMVAVRKMIEDINATRAAKDPQNPMQIEMPLETDLTGVTEKTPIFVSAGRIVDQKGLDILAEGIKEFYKTFEKGSEYPVFYVQGIGGDEFKEAILKAKREVQKDHPEGAKRIVFANLFSEAGRYDLSKVVADWSVMPSWFEPCGLSHKEIGQFSGAGSVVNRTGGLTADLHEGIDVIVSDFNPDKSKLEENGKNFAKAIKDAINVHKDDNKYRQVVESMMTTNFDWAREGGPIFKYLDIFKDLGAIDRNVK